MILDFEKWFLKNRNIENGVEKKSFTQSYYFGRFGSRKDISDEPVCEQEIHITIQGNYNCSFLSVRDEWSLVLLRIISSLCLGNNRCWFPDKRSFSWRQNGDITDLGYSWTGAFSIIRCRILPWRWLLCSGLWYDRTEQFQITRIMEGWISYSSIAKRTGYISGMFNLYRIDHVT